MELLYGLTLEDLRWLAIPFFLWMAYLFTKVKPVDHQKDADRAVAYRKKCDAELEGTKKMIPEQNKRCGI